jgi:uncharacterized membrane protein YedE/YeeE
VLLLLAFSLAFLYGALTHHSRFCTMGALADWAYTGDTARLRMWVLAVAVAMLGFNAMVAMGWISPEKTLYTQPRLPWLALILGGFMFGWGMVWASGCGSRSLTRLGAGNLKALVVIGAMAFAGMTALHGLVAVWNAQWLDRFSIVLPATQDLPALIAWSIGGDRAQWVLKVGSGLAVLLGLWVWTSPAARTPAVWGGGLGVGTMIVAYWLLSGVWAYVPEHPETLQEAFLGTRSNRMESFTFVAPVAYLLDWFMYFSDQSRTLTMAMVTIPGVILGAAVMALLTDTFQWQGFRTTQDFVHHLVGGLMMGCGGVLAWGCTIGQGITGISTLSIGSFLSLAAMVLGAWGALKYQWSRA